MSDLDFSSLIQGAGSEEHFEVTGSGRPDLLPLPAGVALKARLVGYVELGIHEGTLARPDGTLPKQDKVRLFFQVFGTGEAFEQVDKEGQVIPRVVSLFINKSGNEKASWPKLLNKMNYRGDKLRMVDLLGHAFRVKLTARPAGKDGKPQSPVLKWEDVASPLIDQFDDEGNVIGQKEIPVPAPSKSELKLFQFLTGTKAQWDTLPDFLKDEIKASLNLDKSPAKAFEHVSKAKTPAAPKNASTAPQKAPSTPVDDSDDLFGDDSL